MHPRSGAAVLFQQRTAARRKRVVLVGAQRGTSTSISTCCFIDGFFDAAIALNDAPGTSCHAVVELDRNITLFNEAGAVKQILEHIGKSNHVGRT